MATALRSNWRADRLMSESSDPIVSAKREAFGDKADLASVNTVGSGVSESTRMSLNLFHDPGLLEGLPTPWTENRDMIMRLFGPIFERSPQCPGRERAQCCQANQGQACFPNWREREDPEWYALKINSYLSVVNARIVQEGPLVAAVAADEAFELGCLFIEALIKFRWDSDAQRGAKIAVGAKLGGEMRRDANRNRWTPEETITAVEQLLANGIKPMAAYKTVADRQGVSEQTIRKEYRVTKKSR